MTQIRILLVQQDLSEAQFIRDALDESQESCVPGSWSALEVTHIEALNDAQVVAAAGEADVILLDPALDGVTPYSAFRTLREAASEIPIILLLNAADEGLAGRLLRDGAQDYLIKTEIDCGPLLRSIRNALERQRHLNGFRRNSTFDDLTGLFNDTGFHAAGTRELHLAGGSGQPLLLVLAEIENLEDLTSAYGLEMRDTCLIDAADVLRANAGQMALLGCFDSRRFAALVWNMRPEEFIGRIQSAMSSTARPFAFEFGWAVTHPGAIESLDPLLVAAESSLCDNERTYSADPTLSRSTLPTVSAIARQA